MKKPTTETVQLTTLANGVRVVSETITHVQSASLGIYFGAGSRDETDAQRGISHFIEHMMFKGSKKRTAREIADSIESRGGHLNAFTTKEHTCYEARTLAEDVPLAMDVLTDMLRASLFDKDEMEREKRVVLEEIKMYEDTPEETVHDIFEQTLFPSHPLGQPIIGYDTTVSAFTREDIVGYIGTQYRPDRIIVAAAGNLDHAELVEMTAKVFNDMDGTAPVRNYQTPDASGASKQVSKRDIEQVHFCYGAAGYTKTDKRRYPLMILNNVLGGNMSSRLFQEIREKRGLAYAIGSYPRAYMDGGFFCVYGGTSPDSYAQVLELTQTEFKKVLQEGITDDELSKAITQVRGALVLGLEGMTARMHRYGDSVMTYGRVISIDEIMAEFEAVTHDKINSVAQEILGSEKMTLTAIGPFDSAE